MLAVYRAVLPPFPMVIFLCFNVNWSLHSLFMSYFDLFRLDIVIDIIQFRRNKEMQMEGWKKWSTLYSTSAFGQFVHSLNTVRPKRIHISNIISGKCYFQENSKSDRKLELANWNIKSIHHLHQLDQAYLYIPMLYLNF